eukprot:Blabericola_migrator_1__3819@NODE_214_length_11335_cov_18_891374_g182_i0_p2_GENE_NODE_214_length_11335_cov_18_891374_g182_i0NODE_214_length_11335_cov_18_891374_g182_i0_p2_ORF_typecomplete_len1416_score300_06DUF2745/PF10922_8/0_04_NODE_214_length_11335_cov_18_891374_g182_i0671210959
MTDDGSLSTTSAPNLTSFARAVPSYRSYASGAHGPPSGDDSQYTQSQTSPFKAYSSVQLPGIPIANGKCFLAWRVKLSAVIVLYAALCLLVSCVKRFILDLDLILDPVRHQHLRINVKNCHVNIDRVNELKPVPLLSVSAWMIGMKAERQSFFFPDRKHVLKFNDQTHILEVDLQSSFISTYFQCSIRLYLDEDYVFDSIDITAVPDDPYLSIKARHPLKAKSNVTLSVFHGLIELDSIEAPVIDFKLGDGSLKFALDGNLSQYEVPSISDKELDLKVQTVTAPTFIRTCQRIKVVTRNITAERSLFRSDGDVSVHQTTWNKHLVTAALEPHMQSEAYLDGEYLHMMYASVEGPLYLIARDREADLDETDLTTWAGTLQQKPRLSEFSLTRLDELKDWIADDRTANWIASLKVTGEGLPQGHWRFLSSPAFIDFNFWFMVTSAGLLTPRTLTLPVHLFGLHCNWNDLHRTNVQKSILLLDAEGIGSTAHSRSLQKDGVMDFDDLRSNEEASSVSSGTNGLPGRMLNATGVSHRCGPETMDRIFRVFWHTFEQIHAPSVYPLWKNAEGRHFYFDIKTDSVVIKQITRWEFKKAFYGAVAVNALVATAGGVWFTIKIFQVIDEGMVEELINEANLDQSASHRLDHEVGSFPSGSWYISVCRMDRLRGHFFRIRWLPRSSKIIYIAIHICPVRDFDVTDTVGRRFLVETAAGALKSRHEFFFTLKTSDVVEHVATLAGVQDQLCIPAQYPCVKLYGFPQDLTQKWHMNPRLKYRFRILGFSHSNTLIEISDWSQEVVVGDSFQILRIPSMSIRRLKAAHQNSLSLFLLKHCLFNRSPCWDLRFGTLHLEVFAKSEGLSQVMHDMPPSLYLASDESEGVDLLQRTTTLKVAMYIGLDGMKARTLTDATHHNSWHQCLVEETRQISRDLLSDASSRMYMSSPHHKVLLSLLLLNSIDRMFSVEVTSMAGGKALAYGAVPIEGIQLAASQHLASYWDERTRQLSDDADSTLSIKINLSSSATNEPWGKLEAFLDTSELMPYIRHKFPSDPTNRGGRRASVIATTQPCFLRDPAGQSLLIGMDHVLRWYWPTVIAKADYVYIHVIDDITNQWIVSLHDGKALQNTGTFTWAVWIPMGEREVLKRVRLIMSEVPYNNAEVPILAQSHACFILRTLPLAVFEFHYASFCRTVNLPMIQVSAESLLTCGITVSYHPIRVCSGMRDNLPFEHDYERVYCPGQIVVSTTPLITELSGKGFATTNDDDQISTVDVIKSQNVVLPIVENLYMVVDPWYWKGSPDILTLSRNWMYWLPGLGVYRWLAYTLPMAHTGEKTKTTKREESVFEDRLYLLPTTIENFFWTRWLLFELTPIIFQSLFVVIDMVGTYAIDLYMLMLFLFSNFLVLVSEQEALRNTHPTHPPPTHHL